MEGESNRENHVPVPKAFTQPELEANLRQQFEAMRLAGSREAAREEFLKGVRNRSGRLLRGHEDTFARIYARMESMLAADDDEFPKAISRDLATLFERLFQNPEFVAGMRANEREERELAVASSKGIALSPESMLFGNIDGKDFRLHVAGARTLSAAEILVDTRRGMRELARRLEDDPAFADVQEVVGTSWIVGEHPRVAEQMGFTLSEEPISPEEATAHFGGETRVVRRASIDRQKFLKLYGRKKTP